MSLAVIEEFYRKVFKDPALITKICQGTSSTDDLIRNAIKEAENEGYKFTFEEANTWLKKHPEIKPGCELSDYQLERVVGGKS
jgi:hypothetical protein